MLSTWTSFYNGEDCILKTTPVVGLLRQSLTEYILAEILRCPHNEVKISQRWSLIHDGNYSLPIASDTSSISFQNRTIKKVTRFIYNAEHWILKLQSWFLVSQVECWLHNLHVVYFSRMLGAQFSRMRDHVKCWEFKLECWNGKLKVGCYNLISILIS